MKFSKFHITKKLFKSKILFFCSQESINPIKLNEFNENLLERYISPGSSNVIILLLITDRPNDPCTVYFHRQISLIKE